MQVTWNTKESTQADDKKRRDKIKFTKAMPITFTFGHLREFRKRST